MDLKVINFFHAQLRIEFIMLINVKVATLVGIFTFIGIINTTSECLKQEKSLFLNVLLFMSNVDAQLILA